MTVLWIDPSLIAVDPVVVRLGIEPAFMPLLGTVIDYRWDTHRGREVTA